MRWTTSTVFAAVLAAAVAAQAPQTRIVDLGHPIAASDPSWDGRPAYQRMPVATFDKETEQRLWADVRKDAMTLGQGVIQRYIEGAEGIPPNTAHFFGYRIVTAYKANHPGVTAASLTGATSAEIYEESGYEP